MLDRGVGRKVSSHKQQRRKGQSLIEFALTLPILLLVTMGIFDFGRALFTYAEASNAVRNAVRYGSILGYTTTNPQYTDCAGIMAIARRMSFATPSTLVVVSYIDNDWNNAANAGAQDGVINEMDAIRATVDGVPNTPLQCRSDTPVSSAMAEAIAGGTNNGDIVLVQINANVSMITPVFPRYMPIVINGQRTLIKEISLAGCGDGVCDEDGGEYCGNCWQDCTSPPAPPTDPTTRDETGGVPMVTPTITATAASSTSIDLTWTTDAGTNTYYIEVTTDDPTSPSALWQTVGAPVGFTHPTSSTSHTVPATPCATYSFRIRSYRTSTGNFSPWSAASSASPAGCGPVIPTTDPVSCGEAGSPSAIHPGGFTTAAPCNLVGAALDTSTIRLKWWDNATNDDNFYVYYYTAAAPTPVLVSITGNGATTGFNSGSQSPRHDIVLSCGTTYSFYVIAHQNGSGGRDTQKSNTINVPLNCAATPSTPVLTIAPSPTSNETQREISWTASTPAGFTYEYTVEWKNGAAGTWTALTPTTSTTLSHANTMSCETTYFYRVQARRTSDSQISAYSSEQSFTSSACSVPAPTLTLTGGNASRTVSWTSVAVATSYVVERRVDGGTWSNFATLPGGTLSTPDNEVQNECGHSFEYRVRAVDSGGIYSAYSNIGTHSTGVCVSPPSAPTNLVVEWSATDDTTQFGTISLRFQDNAGNETGYQIESATNAAGPWTAITGSPFGSVFGSGSTTSWYTQTNRSCGFTYYYRVRSVGPAGNSAWLTSAGTPVLCPPVWVPVRGGKDMVCGNGGDSGWPELDWSTITGATQYRLEAKSTISSTWASILSANITACVGNGASRCWQLATYPGNASQNYRLRACVTTTFFGTVCSWPRVPSNPAALSC